MEAVAYGRKKVRVAVKWDTVKLKVNAKPSVLLVTMLAI
jgi:hypothetical protein